MESNKKYATIDIKNKNGIKLLIKKYMNKRNKLEYINKNTPKETLSTNLFITQKYYPTLIEKPALKKSHSLKFIKDLLLNNSKKKILLDGYAIYRKKYSYKELIEKLSQNENRQIIEKNKLFKNPYPLLKFLSNRKLYNNSKSLLNNLLNNDISKINKVHLISFKKKDDSNNSSLNISQNYVKKKYFINKKKNKNKLFMNLNQNIRLLDFLKSNDKIVKENTSILFDFDNSLLVNCRRKSYFPLLNKYVKDVVIQRYKNNNSYYYKDKCEQTSFHGLDLSNKSSDQRIKDRHFSHNNASNCYDEYESFYKIKKTSNNIFNKKLKQIIK